MSLKGPVDADLPPRRAPEFREDHRCVECGQRLLTAELKRERPTLAAGRCFDCVPLGAPVPEFRRPGQ